MNARSWVLGICLTVAAGLVSVTSTAVFDQNAPFVITGDEGAKVSSRSLTAAVQEITFADRVSVDEWHADGRWLVVTLVASAPLTEVDAAIELATLEVDGQIFQASERPGESIARTNLHVGIDTVGVLAFELPERVRGGDALLRLSPTLNTPRLDDLVTLPISLDGLPTEGEVEIERPQLVGAP